MTSRHRKQHPDFRRPEVTYIMQRWNKNNSCSLVGVGSIGKTNLLQHLSEQEVINQYLGAEINNRYKIKPLIIDPNLIGVLPENDTAQIRAFAGYELIMHRLYTTMYPFDDLSDAEMQELEQLYLNLSDGRNPMHAYMSLRYLERALDLFFRKNVKIVLMLDEFEEMLKNMPVKFFQTLRGLRDANKGYLSYLTFTRSPLPVLVRHLKINKLDIEPFVELFNDNLLYVGPYDDADARRMVDSLINPKRPQPEHVKEFIIRVTGGFAGLIRATFSVMETYGDIDANAALNEETVKRLASRRAIKEECRTIWTSLLPEERYILKVAAQLEKLQGTPDGESVNMLVNKKLMFADKLNGTLEIKPALFRAYVMANPEIAE